MATKGTRTGGDGGRTRRKSKGQSKRDDSQRRRDGRDGREGRGKARRKQRDTRPGGRSGGRRGDRRGGGGSSGGGAGVNGNTRGGNYGNGVFHDERAAHARTAAFEDLFTDASKAVKAIGLHLREIVRAVLPESEERVYPTWKIALYNEPTEVCGIQLVGKHCNLYFSNGANMNDPDGLLEGAGKTIRHVKVKSTDEPPEDQLKDLILEAKKVARG